MTQEELELKEFHIVINKLKQKALIAKSLSVGLVAVSGLLIAGSLSYMFYQIAEQKNDLENCNQSKTDLIIAVRNSSISEEQKNQILGTVNSENSMTDTKTDAGINSGLAMNDNRSIISNSSPGKVLVSNSSQPSVTPTASRNPTPDPTATDSPNQSPTKEETAKPKKDTNNSLSVNINKQPANKDVYNPKKDNCEEIKKNISVAQSKDDTKEINKWRNLYKQNGCKN